MTREVIKEGPALKEMIHNDESLEIFIRKIGEFNQAFCDFLMKGSDFTLRLEVRGNKMEVLHVRVYTDDREQPKGAQKRIDNKI